MAAAAGTTGFFNAHCHLELSWLRGKIPQGLSFVEWLKQLLVLRGDVAPGVIEQGIDTAIQRIMETRTLALADVLARDHSDRPLRMSSIPTVLHFREMIDFIPGTAALTVEKALTRQVVDEMPHGIHSEGLSPHAPYTTTEALLRATARVARDRGQWLCIHAAESPEETEMFLHGSGPLKDHLAPFLPLNWEPPRKRPVEWLQACGCLGPGTLLVHCNEIDDGDIRLIRETGCSVVVCPGSHIYFQRGEFPLKRLCDADVPVYIGTDSLASNDDLDMEREIRLAAELSPGMSIDRLYRMADARRAERFLKNPYLEDTKR